MISTLPNSEDTYPDPFIQTAGGLHFRLAAPDFDLADISTGLGFSCRYNGQISRFYSIAEHSVLVADLMAAFTGGDPMEGLLHDATEAYLTDVPSPFKQLLPDWQKLDKALDAKLREHFNLPAEKTAECKRADWLALFIEAYHLTADKGACFADPCGLRKTALALVPERDWQLHFHPPGIAPAEWLWKYNVLDSWTGRR